MKKILIVLVVVLVGIQFIPVERTNPPVKSDLTAPQEIRDILRRACYNCHSNETSWVWYTKIAPSSFLAVSDVNDARKHLNFSEWGVLDNSKQKKLKEKIWEEIREEQMPLWQYKILHSESKLTQKEKNLIRNWGEN